MNVVTSSYDAGLGYLMALPLALNESNGSGLVGNQDVAELRSNGGTHDCNLGHPSGRENAEPDRQQGLEGAIIIGKTVTSEFGMYAATSCRNPHDASRSAGVSSAGSAAAVADFMVPLALGTQHTASTLLPASFCGAFGFKPTSGLTSMHGSNILTPRLVNIGFLARSVEDLALFVSVFSATAEASLTPCKAPRLGWVRGPAWSKVPADTDEAFAAFRSELPVSVDEVELPSEFDQAEGITHTLLAAHMVHRFGSLSESALEGYCPPLRDLVAAGGKLDARSYIASDIAANHLAELADRLFADVDALITLSALGEATLPPDPGSGVMCCPGVLRDCQQFRYHYCVARIACLSAFS